MLYFRTLGSNNWGKRKEQKSLLIVATKFCLQHPRAAQALLSDQNQNTVNSGNYVQLPSDQL